MEQIEIILLQRGLQKQLNILKIKKFIKDKDIILKFYVFLQMPHIVLYA